MITTDARITRCGVMSSRACIEVYLCVSMFAYECMCMIVRAHVYNQLKGEIQNRFNLISEERVTNFEQNSENLMKIV